MLLLLLRDRQLPDLPLAQRLPSTLTGEQPKLLLLLLAQVVAISETEKHSKEISVPFHLIQQTFKGDFRYIIVDFIFPFLGRYLLLLLTRLCTIFERWLVHDALAIFLQII